MRSTSVSRSARWLVLPLLGWLGCTPASSGPSDNGGESGGNSNGGNSGNNNGGAGGRGSGGSGAGGAGSGGASNPGGSGGASGSPGSGGGAGAPMQNGGSGGQDAAAGAGSGGAMAPGDAGSQPGPGDTAGLPKFSFFVTSIDAVRALSKNPKGFGGDLRFGKPDGLSGADEICRQIAEMGMTGAGRKTWRAFLSASAGPEGMPVNAIDRIGPGPWFDRVGRMVAANKADLANARPRGAAPQIINDLPNEKGIPNGHPNPGGGRVDNHHMLTGSKPDGTLHANGKGATCMDWTSSMGNAGKPRVGVAWPRSPGDSWISWGFEGGCAPGTNLVDGAGPTEGNTAVGSNGGYGGFYCFALEP